MWLLLISVTLVGAQWNQILESLPPKTSTGPEAAPLPRKFAATWCANADAYIFGGDTTAVGRVRDFYKFEGGSKRWIWMPDGPGPIGRSQMAFWTTGDRFWLYGGKTDDAELDDLWSFTLADRTWHAMSFESPPGPAHGALYWSHPGGFDIYTSTGIWHYMIANNEWWQLNTSLPFAYNSPGLQFAQIDHFLYILTSVGDFLRLDTVTLTIQPLANRPSRRQYGALFVSATKDMLVLFGGMLDAQSYRDLWHYNLIGDVWVELGDATRPSARYGSAVCGGYILGGGGENDVWLYGPKPGIQDIIGSIKFNLDSATLSATWAAGMSTIVFIYLLIVSIVMCVRNCRDAKRPMPLVPRRQQLDENDL